MNCANHQQTPAAAYCRTCGKPLCTNCTRPVMGVIYCENCVAEKMAGTAPPQTYPPAAGYQGPIHPISTGPNPGLAGVLGAIPFGVGAIYNGQYTKGLTHLGIFVFLVFALSSNLPDYMYPILGITMAFFVVYQIIDAVKTAKAIQASQPVPDPFGLTAMFSPGERADFSRGIPTGAVVLIGLGVLFLLRNLFSFGSLVPVLLIGLGVWLVAQRKSSPSQCNRSIAGPAALVAWGAIWLIGDMHGPNWEKTWPVILLVVGVIKLMERGSHGGGSMVSGPQAGSDVPPQQQPPNEVNSEVKNG